MAWYGQFPGHWASMSKDSFNVTDWLHGKVGLLRSSASTCPAPAKEEPGMELHTEENAVSQGSQEFGFMWLLGSRNPIIRHILTLELCAAFSRKNCPTCWQFCYPGLIRPGHIGNSYLPGKSNGKFSEPVTYGADSCLPLMPLKYHQYIQVNQMMCPHPLEDAQYTTRLH